MPAASVLQMALGRVGGILEAKKIAGMAEAVAARHPYTGTRLHLEMLDEPVQ